jgi:chromosome segregation ATPase
MLDLAEIKSRINPAYADRRGTESHERKMLCDEIERLRVENAGFLSEVTIWKSRAEKFCNEIERLREKLDYATAVIEQRNGEIERMCAENEADALRYRLLRRGQHWAVINGIGDELRADDLDAEINAVMKGGE